MSEHERLARQLTHELLDRLDAAEVNAVGLILNELWSAKTAWPSWPKDQVHAAAVLNEEAGELVKAVNDHIYKGGPFQKARDEAMQTGAMAIRFIANAPHETPTGELVQ